ncbi:MAG: hypothetical protein E7554_07255 [Ruminococcaceae bacterium]|nr:hypothetical protein [Oscillospiraceae bacterium]
MLNRNIPVYEGNQPYIYACYSPEDEMLVLPVLTRMYNEGFRFWSANLVEKLSDFIAVRHVSTSACVVIFMSHNMIERINSGVPEVLAACRSSLLRAVVLLDDVRPDNRIFALTSPERMEYQRSNDAGFWLNVYSADYLERCRGPWPEVKLSLQEPTYEDVRQDAIAAEYISLENIITRGGAKPEEIAAAQPYPNNKGYIQPQPDEFTYEPLGKVEAIRTEHDRDYDDAIALLNQCADRQVDIIINHTRPGQNTVQSLPTLSPIRPMPDKQAELDAIKEELARSAQPVERPERRVDPEVRTKADMIVEPEDKPEEAPAAEETAAETGKPETIPYIPEPEITVQSIAESIRQLTLGGAEAQQPAEETTESENEQTEPAAEEIAQEIIAEDAGSEDRSESVTEKKTTAESAKTTVQVVVRKPQPVVRVTPVKKRVITEPARSTNASRTSGSNSRPKLSRSSVSGHLRAVESDPIAFEQYIRDIALAAVSTAEKTAEEAAPVSHRRFGRISRAAEMPAETASQPVAVAVSQREEAQPVPQQNKPEAAAEVAAEETAAGEKTSRRKSRFPHNSEALTGLIAALRKERSVAREESEPAQTEAAEVREIVATVRAAALAQDNAESAQAAESGVKVIRLSDAISERKVSDLQEAVNKFMSLDSNPEAVPLTARVCLRRR